MRPPHALRIWIVAAVTILAYIVPTWASEQARFGMPVVSTSKNSTTTRVVAADLDGDGVNEIISAAVALKAKPPFDGFVINVTRVGGVVEEIAQDLDEVLDLDVADVLLRYPGPEILVSTESGLVTLWRGVDETGAPAWRATINSLALVSNIVVADVNGDGRGDVVGTTGNTSPGNASPGAPPGNSTPGGDPKKDDPKDDPKPPSNATPFGVVAWLGSINGSALGVPVMIGPPTKQFGLGDIDGDRDVDLVLTRSGGLQTLFNNGGGVYTIVALSALPYPAHTDFLVLDTNRDGSADIVFGSGPYIIALLGTGDGRFDDVAIVATVPALGGAEAGITAIAAEPPKPKSKKTGPPALLIVSNTENGPQPLMMIADAGAGYGDPFLASSDIYASIGAASFAGNLNGDPFVDLVAIEGGRSVAWFPGVPTLEDYQALSEDHDALEADYQAALAENLDLQKQLQLEQARNAALQAKLDALTVQNADLELEKQTLLALNAVLTAENRELTQRLLGEPQSREAASVVYEFVREAFDEADAVLDDPRLKTLGAQLAATATRLATATTVEDYREVIRESRAAYQRLQRILADPRPPKPPKPKK